jgi:fucose permease
MRLKGITTIAYCGAFFCLGIAFSVLGPTLPHLAEQVAVSIGSISILFVANSGGYLVGSYLAGPVFDHWKSHPVLAINLGLLAGLFILVPVSSGLGLLIAIFILLGVMKGSIDVGGNTLLLWLFPKDASIPMSALHALFAVGAVVTPVTVGISLSKTAGVDFAYFVLGAMILPFAFLFLFLPSPKVPPAPKVDVNGSGARGDVILISIFFFFYCGVEVGFGGWITTYALKGGFEAGSGSAYLASTYWAFFTVGRIGSILTVRIFTPIRIIGAALTLAGVSIAMMVVFQDSRTVLWAGSAVLGLAVSPIFPQLLLVADARLHLRGSTSRWFFVGGSIGSITITWSLGQGFEYAGTGILMPAMMAILLANAACYVLLLRRLKSARYKSS